MYTINIAQSPYFGRFVASLRRYIFILEMLIVHFRDVDLDKYCLKGLNMNKPGEEKQRHFEQDFGRTSVILVSLKKCLSQGFPSRFMSFYSVVFALMQLSLKKHHWNLVMKTSLQ